MKTRTEPRSRAASESGPRRISISLTGRAAEVVRELAQQLDLSEGDVVRRAIGFLALVNEETERGGAVMVKSPNGEIERLRFLPTI